MIDSSGRYRGFAILLLATPMLSCSSSPGGGPPGGDGGGGGTCPAGVVRLVVSPSSASLVLSGGTPPQQQFTVQGELAGGGTVPVAVTWSVSRGDDGPTGTIDGTGRYTADPSGGGTIVVKAAAGSCEGTATLEVRVDREVQSGSVPSDVATSFMGSPSTDVAKTPLIVYPSSETRLPRNVFKILFQWRRAGNDTFRLDFEGPRGRVRVYTDGVHAECASANPPAGCWEAPDEVWSWIASTHAGSAVTLRVAGALGSTPGTYYESTPITLYISRRDVRGAIFYWSTTSAGIRRSTVSDLPPDDYLAKGQFVDGTEVKCAACHTLSRDGTRLAAYINGNLWVTQVTPDAPPPPVFQGLPEGAPGRTWATFSPDNSRIALSAKGVLTERDGTTGALLAAILLPQGKFGTHPDWSPTGTQIAFALSEDADSDKVSGSDIALLERVDGGLAYARTLVTRGFPEETNAYPAVSPQGDFVAFVRSDKNTHGDDTAKLWMIPASGGAPARLDAANFVVNNETVAATAKLQNNMPTWAPPGDLDWIAFSSKRAYGVVYETGPQQIWIAAIDLSRSQADGGVDPSYPAFRLPFQSLDENNHRPFWSLDVRRDPPPDGGMPPDAGTDDGGTCTAEGMPCDQQVLQCCRGFFCGGTGDGPFTCMPIR